MPTQAPQLRDIHVPHVSAWWPLAPGWWILLAFLVLAAVFAVIALRRRRARARYVHGVLATLRDAEARYASDGDAAAFASAAHDLLRRVARTRDPASVTLSSRAWRDTLARLAPRRDITRLVILEDAMYRPGAELDIRATAADVDAWVRDVLATKRGRSHAPA